MKMRMDDVSLNVGNIVVDADRIAVAKDIGDVTRYVAGLSYVFNSYLLVPDF